MNPVPALAPFFFKFHLNITLPSAPEFPSCLFSFCHQNPIRIFVLFPAHITFLDLIILIFGEEYKSWNCHDAVFSCLLSILPTETQISSSARYSLTSSHYVLNYFAFSLLHCLKFGIFLIRNFCPCITEQGRAGCNISDLHSGDASFGSVRHQVLHKYKTGKTVVLYILIYTFLICKGVCVGDIFFSVYGAFLTSLSTPHQTTFVLFGRYKFGALPFR